MSDIRQRPDAEDARRAAAIDRIVLIGNEHSRLGGVSAFMDTLAHGFLDRGYAVEIIGMKPTPKAVRVNFGRDPRIRVRTIYDIEPPAWQRLSGLHRLNPKKAASRRRWDSLRHDAIDRLRLIVAEWGPETLVICTQIYAMEHLIPAGLECGLIDSPYVIAQYHGSREGSVLSGSIRRLRRWYADSDRMLALTAEDAEQFRRLDQLNNTGWVFNPLPPGRETSVHRHNEVVSLGRYDREKSLDWVLRAWAALAPDFPDWRLRLYGEGASRDSLASLIDRLGIAGSATLEGITADPEGALRRAKIHVMSSQHEGLPLTIAEAGRAGVPTVSFDSSPGVRALIANCDDGVLVPKNHLVALVDSLRCLMSDEGVREAMGVRAHERSSRFDLGVILDVWEHEMRALAGPTDLEKEA